MDSGKEINILMILFITFIAGLATGMALPDGLTQIIVGIVLALIVLGLCLKSVIEHLQAHDQRVIEMTDMAHYANAIYGNQEKEKQKQEKQDDDDETELEEVSAGKKAQMLARIKRQREKGLEFEINN